MKRAVLAILMIVAVAFVFNAAAYAQAKAPGVVILKAPNGGVKFDHTAHAKVQGAACTTCHHAAKPEKPMKGAQQACGDCHTRAATPPMKTKLQAAFHDPMAKKGICDINLDATEASGITTYSFPTLIPFEQDEKAARV